MTEPAPSQTLVLSVTVRVLTVEVRVMSCPIVCIVKPAINNGASLPLPFVVISVPIVGVLKTISGDDWLVAELSRLKAILYSFSASKDAPDSRS